MSSTTQKAVKGSVQVKPSNNRLQLVFSYQGKRRYISTGYADTPRNRKVVQRKAAILEDDIEKERFDETLKRYQRASAHAAPNPVDKPHPPSLLELWSAFLEYKRHQCSPSTMRNQYKVFTNYLNDLPTSKLAEATQIRDAALENIPLDSCKRFITRLSACCDWAIASGRLDHNPFQGMASEIKLPKGSQDHLADINPFTATERDLILEALQTDQFCSPYARVKHHYYYPYYFFSFKTGCRPSEAIALQWQHISRDFQQISFEQAVVTSEAGRVCKVGLKTQQRRRFPCNPSLSQFLQTLRPAQWQPDSLLFPSPQSGTWLDPGNLQSRIWKPLLEGLGLEYRKPYQTRHTFITLALEHRMEVKDVAKLVGNSPEVIYRHYAGQMRRLTVPEF
ncbi:Arm DNA-binding domain-containing protein [Leptolyngbya iicbica]|uniref:DUF3596 domain-containing protein n=1 Tax=Lyngbya confervoides BDU141951 TaxID=1574623 RepID=A0A0C1VCL4_9CYAN